MEPGLLGLMSGVLLGELSEAVSCSLEIEISSTVTLIQSAARGLGRELRDRFSHWCIWLEDGPRGGRKRQWFGREAVKRARTLEGRRRKQQRRDEVIGSHYQGVAGLLLKRQFQTVEERSR